MGSKTGSGDKGDASVGKINLPSGGGPAGQMAPIVDAGAAPLDLIRRAGVLSAKVKVIGEKPARAPAARPTAKPKFPLNPLREGAAIAIAATRLQAAPHIGDAIAPAVMDGGPGPKLPAGKKPRSRARRAKARPVRSKKAKR